MALDNKTVLENLTKQREEIIQQMETGRTTLLKLEGAIDVLTQIEDCLLYTSPSPRDATLSRMPSSA